MVPVLWKTDEFARLVGFDPQALRNWVSAGHVEPAVRGTGRGSVHLFDARQAFAMAAIAVMSESSRGITYGYAKQVLAWFAALPPEFGTPGPVDAHAEETADAWLRGPARLPLLNPEAAATAWDAEEQRRVCAEIDAAWLKIEAAIRERVSPPGRRPGVPANRMKGKATERAK